MKVKTNKIFNLVSPFQTTKAEDGAKLKIRGMASTKDEDRAGDIISADAWAKGGLKDFMKNPIILFNHNYSAPIGKATEMSVTAKGLELEAEISEAAPNGVHGLIKDGVLGAFSVGFRIKDADFIEETGGLMIKDAELFEVSVVSVPCNQDATFSIAKSFESESDYEEFKQTFTHSVDLAGQSLAKEEANASESASNTPDGANAQQEIKMTEEEIRALAEKAAESVATKFAVKQAEKEAAEKLAAKKAEEDAAAKLVSDEVVATTIKTGIESGTEKLMADVEAKMAEKDAKLEEVMATFKTQLDEKSEEITKLNESKRMFADRDTSKQGVSAWGREFMEAKILGIATGKGWNTDFARDLAEKAGVDYTQQAGDIDQEISSQIEAEITVNTRVADMFQSINVNGLATVLPIQPDVALAKWQAAAAYAENEGILESLDVDGAVDTASTYEPRQVIMNAYRLVSTTFLDDQTDERVLISIMPMLVSGVARAHARAVETALLQGNGGTITGLDGYAAAQASAADDLATAAEAFTAAHLMTARKNMGKYGINPSDVAYIVSVKRYYELIEDTAFQDISQVGGLATKLKGAVGSVYGSEVVVSDEFPAEAAGAPVAFAVNSNNYAIPRLRDIRVERDREVAKQRNLIVASQSLGFTEFVGKGTGNAATVKVDITA